MEKDEKAAARFYQLSSDQGHIQARNAYARCLQTGKGVAEDKKLAFELYRKSAEEDDDADAEGEIARAYVCKDDKEASRWYLRSAENGRCYSMERSDKFSILA